MDCTPLLYYYPLVTKHTTTKKFHCKDQMFNYYTTYNQNSTTTIQIKDEVEVTADGAKKLKLYLYCCGGDCCEPIKSAETERESSGNSNSNSNSKAIVSHQEYLSNNVGAKVKCWKVCLSRLVDIKLGAPSHLSIRDEDTIASDNCFSITTLDGMLHIQTDTPRSCTKWWIFFCFF